MKTTTTTESRTTTVSKNLTYNGVSVTVSRRFIELETPFVSDLEYAIQTDTFTKNRMNKHSFIFHLEMIKNGQI